MEPDPGRRPGDPYEKGRALLEPLRKALAEVTPGPVAAWADVWGVFREFLRDPLDADVVAHEMVQFEIGASHADGGCTVALGHHVYVRDVDEPIVCMCELTYSDVGCRPALVHGQPQRADTFTADVERAMEASGLPSTPARVAVWVDQI